MEVPVINRVGDLQMVIGKTISRILIEEVPQIFSVFKWGALILAVYAIVNSLLVSFRIQLVRFRDRHSTVSKSFQSYTSDEDDYSSDEDDDCSVSSCSVNEEEFERVSLSNKDVFSSLFNFREAGSSCFEEEDESTCRFTWSNFVNGKSVVKLWDGVGLGLDLNNPSGSIVSIHDLKNSSLVLSAGKDDASHPFLSLIDTRLGRQPVITIWSSPAEAIGSGEKLRVVDLRKATNEGDAAEWNGVTWWDAKRVMTWRGCDVM